MNRKCFFALMLLWLISMVSGCFNKQGNAAFEPQETVFTNGAFSLALPCELSNQVIVNPSESFYITDQTVFSVFHADTFAAENLGWIFSICRYTESEYCEEYLQSESRQFSALASSFSRSAAVSYADAYVGNYSFSSGDVADYTYYNKQYKNFNASGGDCANYVSQCLKAAGLGTTSNWYYNNNGSICTDSTHDARVGHTCTNTHICGEAWRRSTELRKELSSYYASTFDTDPSPDSFCVADVGFFGRGATQSHSVICVATGGNSFLINSHNNDRKRVEYNARTIASNSLSRLHIHSGNSWTKYNATYHRGLCNGGCGEFVLAQHYARTPGSNATCLGCGYVGNISIGLMSMGDKLS